MRARYQITTVLILSLLVSVNLSQFELAKENDSIAPISDSFTIGQYGNPIVIRSNSDFVGQGWLGNGSEMNPYILNGISLSTGLTPAIEIRDTDAYFILNNSVLTSMHNHEEGIIALYNVANAIIINCHLSSVYDEGIGIYGSQVSNSSIMDCWISERTGVFFEYSSRCNFSRNVVLHRFTPWGFGVRLSCSNQMFVNDNTVLYREYGILLEDTDDCILTNNSVIGGHRGLSIDWPIGQTNQSERNVVYNNLFGWAYDVNVLDHGFQNRWDDNISLGNAYSDYNESGYYEIPGIAGSIDRYPSRLIEDLYGPRILHYFQYYGVDFIQPGPEFFVIEAEVTDISEVDTVLLNFNGTVHVMKRSIDDAFPNRFRVELPYRGLFNTSFFFTYNFKANDTLGNSIETGIFRGYISVWSYNSQTTSSIIGPAMQFPIFASGIIVTSVCIAILIMKLRDTKYTGE